MGVDIRVQSCSFVVVGQVALFLATRGHLRRTNGEALTYGATASSHCRDWPRTGSKHGCDAVVYTSWWGSVEVPLDFSSVVAGRALGLRLAG